MTSLHGGYYPHFTQEETEVQMEEDKSLSWVGEEKALGLNYADLSLELPDSLGPS